MPTGIYQRTEEHKKHISNGLKKHVQLYGPWNKGIKFSNERKEEISKKHQNEGNPNWRGGKIKIICNICRKEVYIKRNRWELKHDKIFHCSRKCAGKWISINYSGKKSWNWKGTSKKICSICNKEFTDNHYRKAQFCSRKCMGEWMSLQKMGKNNPAWMGGVTPENKKIRTGTEYSLWREAVFARDDWTCQKYGIKGGKLHAHHIQSFAQHPKLRFEIDNGITLSEKAHKEIHSGKHLLNPNIPGRIRIAKP